MRVRSTLVARLSILMMAASLFVCPTVPAGAAAVRVGSDISGAPFEYYQGSDKVPLGFDIDLLHAMAAKMNADPTIQNHTFDDLIAAVERGTFDFAMSAMSDTSAREKHVDFLDYFVAGGGLMVHAGNPLHIFDIGALCGYSVTIEKGTSYEADLQKQSDACKAIGLGPVTLVTFDTDDQAYAAFAAGKAPIYVADYPVAVYRARGANGKYEVVGKQFDVVPYGIAVKKGNADLMVQLQKALLDVIADGTYDKLTKKWGISQGAMRVAPIN
ncbi:MAG: ABC transporter substrate-binding protein, partial [Candidatus Eremiobacteraeota bacterium]|nr:ABC transporter substrate-binding protein [Candidatus Eremiobacteraeota bacterium]